VAADRRQKGARADFRCKCVAFVRSEIYLHERQSDRRGCGLEGGTDFPSPYSRKVWEEDRRYEFGPYSLWIRLQMNGGTSGPGMNWS
jgi:hypothetical protein